MVSVKIIGRNIDFVGNSITLSTSYFFVIILNFIFRLLSEMKISYKQFFDDKKNSSKADF